MGLDYKLLKRTGAVHRDADQPAASVDWNPPRAVLELVPESVARENQIFPLSLDGETLTCAAADPNNILVQDKLSFTLNKLVRLVAAPPEALRKAISRHYGKTELKSVDSMLREFADTNIDFTSQPGERGRGLYVAECAPEKPRSRCKSVTEYKHLPNGLELADQSISDLIADFGRYPVAGPAGHDPTTPIRRGGMLHYVVEEGQRALMVRPDGRMEVITGPRRIWHGRNEFRRMNHFVAHPSEFLIVRFRDGRQEHRPGPAEVWFDPRIHLNISREDALQMAAREAVVVYSRAGENEPVSRRIVYGPTLFVPAPGEWLHTFTWHGADGGSEGARKVAKGLIFQKLWLMPDQMYHDVTDVRTGDDAVLTIRLMIFFELLDIERMLDTTHDPIGDLINAATSDVVDFTGRHSFESFKLNTSRLNDIETYRQLTSRAAQCGYRINKVVYRGYGAPDRLQAMHDQAIEARTKLQLERATEQQAQELEDYKLKAQMARAIQRRTEQSAEVEAELELARRRAEADLKAKEAARTALRQQRRPDAEAEAEVRTAVDTRQREHLAGLKEMGVDLTAYLTQGRADRVIELRGASGTHVHLDRVEGNGHAA
jgi:MshEN domain